MEEWEFEEIAESVVKRVLEKRLAIKGPTLTCYGLGWTETLSFWCGTRRIHIYLDFNILLNPDKTICYTIEIADGVIPGKVLVKETNDFELYWQSIARFLIDATVFSEFESEGWTESKSPQDPWIPTPPSAKHSGDFGEWGDSFFANLRRQLANLENH
jgi:hypothetical protein